MKLEYTTVSDDEPVEIDDEEVALPSQLTEPAALAYKTHPMIPYAEPAFRLVLRGKTYIVKESDLALIDLTPAKGRRWREHGVSDYRVAVHRGWMAPPKNRGGTHKISTNYVPYNPANLGFLDAGRNRQISATYELDINKVKIDHKHWREHVQLIRQWHKVDTMINEDHDIINWARKHNKRMHPLIRSYYRLKRAADKMETIANSNPEDSAVLKRYADVVAKQMGVALQIENLISTTSRYIDGILEQRIRDKDKARAASGKAPILEADAEVMEEGIAGMRLIDVDREMARVMAKYSGDADDTLEIQSRLQIQMEDEGPNDKEEDCSLEDDPNTGEDDEDEDE